MGVLLNESPDILGSRLGPLIIGNSHVCWLLVRLMLAGIRQNRAPTAYFLKRKEEAKVSQAHISHRSLREGEPSLPNEP